MYLKREIKWEKTFRSVAPKLISWTWGQCSEEAYPSSFGKPMRMLLDKNQL